METQTNLERNIEPDAIIAILKAKHDRKVFIEALNNGTLACLPGKDGFADTAPVMNITNGTYYHGINLILLKLNQKVNNYPTSFYLTFDSLQKVNKELDIPFSNHVCINKGEEAYTISYKDFKTNEIKFSKIFNIEQTSNPDICIDYLNTMNNKKEFSFDNSKSKSIIECSSSKPEEYFGQYLAAVSTRSKFKVSPQLASEFSKNISDEIFKINKDKPSKLHPEGTINPFNLNIISSKSNAYCKCFMKAKNETPKVNFDKSYKFSKNVKKQNDSMEIEF